MDKNNSKNNIYKNIYGIKKGIIELTLSDFKYKKKKLYINNDYFKDKKGLIVFYSPLCLHCNKISDLLFNLAESNINLFYFGAVNLDNIKDGNDYLGIYANITKTPTIKYIKNNKELINYPYEYNADNLIYYVNTNI